MAPRAKTAPAKGKSVSKSTKAGLQFPVGRIARYLKKGKYAERLGGTLSSFVLFSTAGIMKPAFVN